MKSKKKFLSLLLTLCMVLALLMPVTVFAASTDTGKAIQLVENSSAANIAGAQMSSVYFGSYQQSEYTPVTVPPSPEESKVYLDSDNTTRFVYAKSDNGWGNTLENYYKIEPIKWRVLANDAGKLLLVSDQGLDGTQFHTDYESVTWNTSTVRSWLNGYSAPENTGDMAGIDYTGNNFLNTAFSSTEQQAIADTF